MTAPKVGQTWNEVVATTPPKTTAVTIISVGKTHARIRYPNGTTKAVPVAQLDVSLKPPTYVFVK